MLISIYTQLCSRGWSLWWLISKRHDGCKMITMRGKKGGGGLHHFLLCRLKPWRDRSIIKSTNSIYQPSTAMACVQGCPIHVCRLGWTAEDGANVILLICLLYSMGFVKSFKQQYLWDVLHDKGLHVFLWMTAEWHFCHDANSMQFKLSPICLSDITTIFHIYMFISSSSPSFYFCLLSAGI